MNVDEARGVLEESVYNDDGTYTRLRLGQDPGEDQIQLLRQALRVLWKHYLSSDTLPRDIAFRCGVILHFQGECRSNIRESESIQENRKSPLEGQAAQIAVDAFDVLAGEIAFEWGKKMEDTGL
jgi:hypothetical protein